MGRDYDRALTDEVSASSGHTRGFLFADLRGYTDFVERRGDDAAAALLERYRTLVRRVVARNAGAEVKTEGDSFYVLFPSASSAVAAGLDIVASAATESAEHPDAPIRVGVGVHAGETSDLPEGPVGSAVNMAARICSQAGAGEMLVSDTVRGLTRTRNVAAFASVGSRKLKGIAEPIVLYRAVPPGTVISGGRHAGSRSLPQPWLGIGGAVVLAAVVLAVYVLGRPGDAGASPTPGASSASPTPPSAATPTIAASPSAAPITGSRIIFSRRYAPGGCDDLPFDSKLYVLDPDHSDSPPHRLTEFTNLLEMSPWWSADGSTVAFAGNIGRGPSGLYAVGAPGSPLVTLSAARQTPAMNFGGAANLTMAPDGSAVVHLSEDQIWMTTIDGSESTQIAGVLPPDEPDAEPPPATELYRDVVYRSDGTLLMLVIDVEGGWPWLETMNDDGSGRVRLDLDLEGWDVVELALADDDDTLTLSVATGPDSSIYVGQLSAGRTDFALVDIEVANPTQASFAPNGDHLVVQAGELGAEELYLIDLASGDLTQLTDDPATSACSPTWRNAPPDLVAGRPEPAPGDTTRFELGRIVAGPVLNDVVEPPIQLTFPDGWYSIRSYVDGWALARPGEAYGQVSAARLQFGWNAGCEETDPVSLGARPDELLTFLQSRDDLVLEHAGPINLGGYSGITVEVSGKEGAGCGDPGFPEWSLFITAEDAIGLAGDEHMRLVALDVRGATRSFLVFALSADFDAYWTEKALPLLQTLTFPDE
jgi:class 3 adenylate cyclase